MDKTVYKKTRYENVYQHIYNKNYLITFSKPVKTSVAKIDNEKIYDIDIALMIRDNPEIKTLKGLEIAHKGDFDSVWNKYITVCKTVYKLEHNTMNKKRKMYNKFIKGKINKKVSKITEDDIAKFIEDMPTTIKQKNEMIRILTAFFNWCKKRKYILVSPMMNINKYRTEKPQMKYWTTDEVQRIIKVLDEDIHSDNPFHVRNAWLIKTFILIGFSLGDRVGETRALTFDSFDENLEIVRIRHSINYDTTSDDFLSSTKNYHSQRDVDVSRKLILAVKEYKQYLINNTEYNIKDSDLIFFNYETGKPYSDVALRKKFYYYCDKANVTRIRMYDLRHTYVATMMEEGKELYHISSRIGHVNYSTTVNRYGHLSNKKRKEIAEITDKYF